MSPDSSVQATGAQISDLLRERLKNLPSKPGVYLFKDRRGEVLYVGKATSLANRVRSYFPNGDGRPKIQAMMPHVVDIDYIVTESPVQALKWESDLIKREMPRYNVRLRDDKAYPYLKITVNEEWPRVHIVRRVHDDGARYFGPFTDANAVRATRDTLNSFFPFIRCSKEITGRDRRPCLYYHIRRCAAPCVGYIDNAGYRRLIDQVMSFLEGHGTEVIADLKAKMEAAAEEQRFELAATYRDRLRAAQRILADRAAASPSARKQDVVGFVRDGARVCVQLFLVRGGQLLGREHFVLDGAQDESDQQVVTAFVQQYYSRATQMPDELLLPVALEDPSTVAAWLREKAGRKLAIAVPRRGEKAHLVRLATENARETLERLKVEWLSDEARTAGAIAELGERLGLLEEPQRIECYDISNLQGTSAVGSMVVFEGGRPARQAYRRFKIKTVEGANDFAMMKEVITRRFKRGRAAAEGEVEDRSGWGKLPDLIIIDGGKGQLNAAREALEDLDLAHLAIVGLAKQQEEIFIPGRPHSLMLPRTSQALFLVQRIRDEAHRFAVTYHRQVRGRQGLRSQLDEIPGIGPKRKAALLRQFGSVRAIKEASLEELAAAPGMTRKTAELLKERL